MYMGIDLVLNFSDDQGFEKTITCPIVSEIEYDYTINEYYFAEREIYPTNEYISSPIFKEYAQGIPFENILDSDTPDVNTYELTIKSNELLGSIIIIHNL